MAGSKTKREKLQRELALLAEPETLDSLCAHIADRGTLQRWCRIADVRYMTAHDWLHGSKDRLERYTRAMECRNAALTDTFVDGVRETAEADITKLFGEDGQPLDPHQIPEELRRVVGKVKVTTKSIQVGDDEVGMERKVEFDLDSRATARDQLGKHLGLYKENVTIGGKIEVTEDPEVSARRVAFLLAAALDAKRKSTNPNKRGE